MSSSPFAATLFNFNFAREKGFTLVEILVVIIIVGIITGIVGFAVGGTSERTFEQEALRLQHVLRLASDEALLRGEEYGLAIKGDSYQVALFNAEQNQWQHTGKRAFEPYKLPENINIELELEGEIFDLKELNEPEKNNTPGNEMNLQTGAHSSALNPGLLLLSSGEITPFIIRLQAEQLPVQYEVLNDKLGDIRVKRVGER